MVNRQDYDCSICPVEDPSTWTADDLDFKVICEDGGGELSFQLDNFLEVNWLQSTTIELVYNSEDNGEYRELVTKTAGTQKKTIPNLVRGCLRTTPIPLVSFGNIYWFKNLHLHVTVL